MVVPQESSCPASAVAVPFIHAQSIMSSLPTMKTMTLVCWLTLVLLWQTALGQGLVNLNNNFTPPGATAKALILDANGQPLAKALGSVEILDPSLNVIKSGHLAALGMFFLGVVEIPETVPGGNGTITIRVWDNTTGATYESATARSSALVTLVGLGGAGFPIPSLGMIGNFTGLSFQCLCPPGWYTSVHIDGITPDGDQVRVLASGSGGISWALWSSTNLVDWVPAGTPQQLGSVPWSSVELEWVVPQPAFPTLYRVIQVQSQ